MEYVLSAQLTDLLGDTPGPMDLSRLPCTDLDAARFIKTHYDDSVLYIPTARDHGDWYVWDGTIWAQSEHPQDEPLVDHYADALRDVVAEIRRTAPDGALDSKHSPWRLALDPVESYAIRLRSTAGQSALRTKLTSLMARPRDHFDRDQRWIVWADGKVTDTSDPGGTLLPPSPDRAVSRKMGVEMGEGHAVEWSRSLDDRGIPAEQQAYLQMAAGAAVLGQGKTKNLPTLVGTTNTGKSSYIETLRSAFGGYSANLPPGAIVAKTSTNFDQHAARGARFIYLEEPYEARTDDSFLKELTGGGNVISTQQKHRDAVSWTPQGVLHIAANHIPKINTQDVAIVDRMNIVRFDHQFAPGDGTYRADMAAWLIETEGPQIAAWIMEGARMYLEQSGGGRIPVPQSIRDNGSRNVVEGSPALSWLEDQIRDGRYVDTRTVPDTIAPSRYVKADKLTYGAFREWCFDQGIRDTPTSAEWRKTINAQMNVPPAQADARPQGYARLWHIAPVADVPSLAIAPNGAKNAPRCI